MLYENYADLINGFGSCGFLVAFDSNTGATDLSGNGRNATPIASVPTGEYSPGPLTAVDYGATDFNGSTHRYTTTYTCFAANSTRTFMGWANRDNAAAIHTLVGGSTSKVSIRVLTNNNIAFLPDTDLAANVWASAWPGNEQWVHWALTYDIPNTTAALYLNGSLVSSDTYSTAYDASPGNLQIAARATEFFNGKQAWVSVHEQTLTADEIAQAHAYGLSALFGSEIPGFLTDSSGNLQVTTDATGGTYDIVPGFYTDPIGRLIVTTTTTNAEWVGGFLRLNDALVVEEAAGTYGSIGSGFTTTSSGALSVVNDGTVDWVNGFMRDSDDSLGVTGLA